jgi:hypothetical protein
MKNISIDTFFSFRYIMMKSAYQRIKQLYLEYKTKTDYDYLFLNDPGKAVLNLEFFHDNKSLVNELTLHKTFWDMETLDIIDIRKYKNVNEKYLKKEMTKLINREGDSRLKTEFTSINNNLTNSSSVIDFHDDDNSNPRAESDHRSGRLSNFIPIFDNQQNTETNRKKLDYYFGIKHDNSYDVFIRKCEALLTEKKTNLDTLEYFKLFRNTNGTLKQEYLVESIKIGFDPIHQNSLINYNLISQLYSHTSLSEIIKKEIRSTLSILRSIRTFVTTAPQLIDAKLYAYITKYKNTIPIDDVIEELGDVLTRQSIDKTKLSKTIQLLLSMKECRDTQYINEIKTMQLQYPDKQFIFLTIDEILAYRCVLSGISVINVVNQFFRFIAFYESENSVRIVSNPFALFLDDEVHEDDDPMNIRMKSIIDELLNHPIMELRKNNKTNLRQTMWPQ